MTSQLTPEPSSFSATFLQISEVYAIPINVTSVPLYCNYIEGRHAVEKIFGKEAARVVEHFLPVGSKQVMESIKDKAGKFGRTLGNFIIFDKEQDRETTINEFMIENNYAVGYHGQSKDSISQEHLDNYVELIKRKPELINEAYLNQYVNSRR